MKAWTNLTRTVAPAVDVLTLAEAKMHLRVDHDYSDAEISAWIAAATSMIDGPNGIGVALISQTWRQSLDTFPAKGIEIRLGPVSAISSITYADTANVTQTLAPTSYAFDLDTYPVTIKPAYGKTWPDIYDKPGAIKVNFVAGYGLSAATVPASLKAAIKLLIGHWYANREAAGDTMTQIPFGVAAILDSYRNQMI